jgi:putative flavoprotein involved in K+ transport
MDLAALVNHFQGWADSFDAPVSENCAVTALEADGDHFVLSTSNGKLSARTVVVASGGYQRPHLPPNAGQLPKQLRQLFAEEYTNPDALPPGAVLIVGSGQTGCQLAEELHEAGRKVFLSCGRCPWVPRRLAGHDVLWWMVQSGWFARTPAQLPSPAARLFGNPQATGHGGGHDLHYRTLHVMGVELVGRFTGAEDDKIHFGDDLAQSIEAGDNMTGVFMKQVDAFCAREGIPVPFEPPPPLRIKGRTELDVKELGAVIWTSGYRPAYDWVHFPVFDDMGFPVQVDGRSAVPGLYFMGLHFQRKAQSAVLYGVGEDAELVARDIAR